MKKQDLVDWDDFSKELEKQPGFKEDLKETELEYQVAYGIIEARIKKGITQEDLAKAMDTKQSLILFDTLLSKNLSNYPFPFFSKTISTSS